MTPLSRLNKVQLNRFYERLLAKFHKATPQSEHRIRLMRINIRAFEKYFTARMPPAWWFFFCYWGK